MRIKKHIEAIANLAFWALLLTVFISLTVQVLPVSKAVGLSLIIVLLLSGTAYFNALFIIPRYFKKGKFGQYFGMIFGMVILERFYFPYPLDFCFWTFFKMLRRGIPKNLCPAELGCRVFVRCLYFSSQLSLYLSVRFTNWLKNF